MTDWRNATIGGYVNPGWEPLVDLLYARLIEIAPDIVVEQVKEKFGTLRFYYSLPAEDYERELQDGSTVRETVERLVRTAETASSWICEVCGKPGYTSSFNSGWLNTLCPEHAIARGQEGTPAWQQALGRDTPHAVLEDYFRNDEEGWTRGWLKWRDRAAKMTGRPTSEEIKAAREAARETPVS